MNNHTFVICAYQESPYLEVCLKSLMKQSIQSNIIIVTSTENQYIRKIAKKYNISMFSHNNGGIGQDWNFGLKMAETKYVTLAHQDDVYGEEYLDFIINAFNKYSDALIAFTDYHELRDGRIVSDNKNLKIKRKLLSPLRLSGKNYLFKRMALSFGNPICCPSVTYNKTLLKNFSFDLNWSTNLDWDAWENLSRRKGRFAYINKPLMLHRIHKESETSNTIINNQRAEEDLEMLYKFWPPNIAKFIFRQYTKSEKSNEI